MERDSSGRAGSGHDHSHPAAWLVENAGLLPRHGPALDIAMGGGRNAVFLAKLGLDVMGIDISEQAVASARRLSEQAGVSLEARVADLENGYRLEPERYDVIICFNYLHRPLMPQIKQAVRPGGFIIYETYIVDQAQWGKPRNPEHLLRHNELLNTFRDFRVLRYREGIMAERQALASLVAQRADGVFGEEP